MAFCRDIPSHEKNPDPGDKKSPGYPGGKKSRKNPESRGFCISIDVIMLEMKKHEHLFSWYAEL